MEKISHFPVEENEKVVDTFNEQEFHREASIIANSKEIPNDVSVETLKAVKEKLSGTIDWNKTWIKENLVYAIPFKPLFTALTEWGDYNEYSDSEGGTERAVDIMMGSSGLNVGLGLTEALIESVELIKNYRFMLKTKRELKNKEEKKKS